VTSSQQQFGGKNDDEVLSVLYRMKEEDRSFIRDVSIGKESLSIVLVSDVQLAEMEKFCNMFHLYSPKVFSSIYDPYQALLLPLKAVVLCISHTHDFWPKT